MTRVPTATVWVIAVLCATGLTSSGCDRVYRVKIEARVPPADPRHGPEVAAALLSKLKPQFHLLCDRPEAFDVRTGSRYPPEFQRSCRTRHGGTNMVLTAEGDNLTLDLSEIGQSSRPPSLQALRLATEQSLQDLVPGATLRAHNFTEP